MTKYTPLLALLLIGCVPKTQHYTAIYQDLECKSFKDVGIKWDGEKYICVGGKLVKPKPFFAFKTKSKTKPKSKGCETTITEIYKSKASGEITICKGKLLEGNQKTRIVRVNE